MEPIIKLIFLLCWLVLLGFLYTLNSMIVSTNNSIILYMCLFLAMLSLLLELRNKNCPSEGAIDYR